MLFWVLSVLLVLGFLGSSLSGWTGLCSPWALSLYFLVFVDLVGLFLDGLLKEIKTKGKTFLYSHSLQDNTRHSQPTSLSPAATAAQSLTRAAAACPQ